MNEPKANTPGSDERAGRSIYVVDDEAMLLEMAAVILEPLAREIRTFRDPQSALRAFTAAQPRPALIITDYSMHAMSGLDLIEACRKIQPNQKILMLSGTVGPDIFQDAAVKPDHFLAKPYHAKQLIDIVKAMLAD